MPVLDALNRPLRDLRISVTDRCNFRCTYCMPRETFGKDFAFLPRTELLSFEEITRLARIFVGLGVSKIRLTGGEPLLRRDIDQLIRMLREIEGLEDLALTTNGSLLPRNAKALKQAGLDRVTVSLDSLDDQTFQAMNDARFPVQRVLDGIEAAADAGLSPVKVNMVVRKGVNDHQIVDMARHFRGSGHVLRFIEFMDVGNTNGWQMREVVPAKEVVEAISSHWPLAPVNPNYGGEVANRYRYVDGKGEIGVIASVTRSFCSGCTRARLSADGKLFTCLFSAGGQDFREQLRGGASDREIEAHLGSVWLLRADRYSDERSEGTGDQTRVEMSYIGG